MSIISVCWNRNGDPPARLLQESMLSAQPRFGSGDSFRWSDEQFHLAVDCGAVYRKINLTGSRSGARTEHSALWLMSAWIIGRSSVAAQSEHPEELADSAFLMAAWERWGPACLDHVVSGFAFAVWAPARQELFAARDHAGERPLFYHRLKGFFALASMAKGLLGLRGVSQDFEQIATCRLSLGRFRPIEPSASLSGSSRFRPGTFSELLQTAWNVDDTGIRPMRGQRATSGTRSTQRRCWRFSIARRRLGCSTTKAVGSFLSAGLDSSSVTASAARILGAKGKSLTAFTAVPRPEFNNLNHPWLIASEGAAASEVARMYPNIEHVLVDTAGRDLLGTMRTWTDAMSEPVFNPVNYIWLTAILDQARERGIGVMLEGVGGNITTSWESEAIFGYFFRRLRWSKLAKTTLSLREHGYVSFRSALRYSLAGLLPDWGRRKLIADNNLRNIYSPLINPELARAYGLAGRIFESRFFNSADPVAEHCRSFGFADFGVGNAATEAVTGVEVRDPTADKRVYDFCFSIPPEQYVAGGHSRSLVRRAMKGRLPDSVRNCYKVGLQGADWYLTLGEALPALREEAARFDQSPVVRQTIDVPRLRGLLDSWPDSGYEKDEVSYVWHFALTRAIGVGYFLRSHGTTMNFAAPEEPHTIGQPVVS